MDYAISSKLGNNFHTAPTDAYFLTVKRSDVLFSNQGYGDLEKIEKIKGIPVLGINALLASKQNSLLTATEEFEQHDDLHIQSKWQHEINKASQDIRVLNLLNNAASRASAERSSNPKRSLQGVAPAISNKSHANKPNQAVERSLSF